MANSIKGAQLNTYNPNIAYFTSTTAGTSALVVYAVEAGRANGGITNAPPPGQYYDGITHFHTIAGKAGNYIGDPGSEIPLTDKQATTVTICTVSAATVTWVVAPFQCTVAGYWTQDGASVAAATANQVAIYAGSSASGGLIATIANPTGGGPGDTYSWGAATPSTVIAGGQPISFNFNTTVLGTAYGQYVTTVFTRVGI